MLFASSGSSRRTRLAISKRFSKLLSSLEPTPSEVTRSKAHLTSIRTCLRNNFNISGTDWIGSHAKGTAIRSYSDLDLLVKLRREELKRGDGFVSSETLLRWVRDTLNTRFAGTLVGRDGLAVVVNFGSGRYAVDVVPGMYAGPDAAGRPIYHIPDGEGGWISTSPGAHQTYFRQQDARTGERLRRVIRLLKHWSWSRTSRIPLSSFHAEIVLAVNGIAAAPGSYSRHFANALAVLAARDGAALRDPIGVSGMIPAASTAAKRSVVVAAFRRDAAQAASALEAEEVGDTQEAIRRWGMVFNGSFPL